MTESDTPQPAAPTRQPILSAPNLRTPLLVALVTTLGVTALSYGLPDDYAATGVGLAFLLATYVVALRGDDNALVRHYGLSLGGVLERAPLNPRRLLADMVKALGWALGVAALIFPLFWLGFVFWWKPKAPFMPAPASHLTDQAFGQLLVIALPEEAFYRGYLQTALDDVWRSRVKILGAELGPGVVVTAAIFAVGHLATELHPNRLAVFFPALLFGWLRVRTKGVGAAVALHALANLFASYLGKSYGLGG